MGTTNIRLCPWKELTPAQIDAWAALEAHALDPNAYLSPHFVLPALQHLGLGAQSLVLLIERQTQDALTLIGLGVFEPMRGSWRFPLPYLRAYRSKHSFLDGLLLDRAHADEAMRAFVDWCAGSGCTWHGVEFSQWPDDSESDRLLRAAAQARRLPWYQTDHQQRAIIAPAQAGPEYVENALSTSLRKDLRRRMRRLEELGHVQSIVFSGNDVDTDCIERFLALEQNGWKGDQGSALNCDANQRRFFHDMVLGFARHGRAVFTELRVNDTVVASTSNFISGRAVFAFKLGWHRDYAKMSPGILNEIEFIRRAPTLFAGLEVMDSGASEGSFIEGLWNQRRTLSHSMLVTSALGQIATGGLETIRRIKRHLLRQGRRAGPATAAPRMD